MYFVLPNVYFLSKSLHKDRVSKLGWKAIDALNVIKKHLKSGTSAHYCY